MIPTSKITGVCFTGKIIDSHAHIGKHDTKTYTKDQLDVFVKSELPNKDTVEKMIVSDLDVLHSAKSEYEGNKAALELFKNNEKYALLASCSPTDGDVKNIKKLFKENHDSFVGLKFHSDIQKLVLSDPKYEPYMKFASKHKLPCLFHSQVSILDDGRINPNMKHISDPESIYTLAKKYKHTPVVMAHLGAGWKESHDKAIDILIESIKKGDANLYADVSWVDIDNMQTHIVKAIKRLKGIGEKDWKYGDQSFRLMFGTDSPLARFSDDSAKEVYSKFVDSIKASIRNDKDLKPEADKIIDDLFYNNAKKLYLSEKKTFPKTRHFVMALAVLGIVGCAFFKAYNMSLQKCGWRESNPRQTRFRKPPLYPTELQPHILIVVKTW